MSTEGYYLDLKQFSLDKLKDQLLQTRVLPSQKILLEEINERFSCLELNGIANLGQLQKALKTKSDVKTFSQETGLPFEYLIVLRREVNSNHPKPIALKDFPGISPDDLHKLENLGIKNTLQLFPFILTPEDRSDFAGQNEISDETILDLTQLTDVARTKWVGPKFARLLVAAGYGSVKKIADSDHEELYSALMKVNQEQEIYKGALGSEDMSAWIDTVRNIPQRIEY